MGLEQLAVVAGFKSLCSSASSQRVLFRLSDIDPPDRIGQGGDERGFRPHGINAPFAKKGEAFHKTSTSSFCVAIAAAEPAASSSSRHVFNGVGVIPSAAATLLCVAPASDNRATGCSPSSAEKRPTRLLAHFAPPRRYRIYRPASGLRNNVSRRAWLRPAKMHLSACPASRRASALHGWLARPLACPAPNRCPLRPHRAA